MWLAGKKSWLTPEEETLLGGPVAPDGTRDEQARYDRAVGLYDRMASYRRGVRHGRRWACWLAALVYLAFIGSLAVAAQPALAASTTLNWASPIRADDQPPFASGGASITGVSCPSTSLCIAVDSVGDMLVSTDPTGGTAAWARAASVANTLADVSCPSTELCVAIGGGSIATSTDPTGGASTWTVTKVLPDSSEYRGGSQLATVSCALVSLCVVTDERGDVLTLTDPTGGAGAWTTTTGVGLGSVSCPFDSTVRGHKWGKHRDFN